MALPVLRYYLRILHEKMSKIEIVGALFTASFCSWITTQHSTVFPQNSVLLLFKQLELIN
jgi:hypothetical protein